MKSKLLKVSTYARLHKKSIAWAYKEIRLGKVRTERVDGVIFIVTN